MNAQKNIIQDVQEHLDDVVKGSPVGQSLWRDFLTVHPADIAQFFADNDRDVLKALFLKLPLEIKLHVFEELSDVLKVYCLSFMDESEKVAAFNILSADQLTDLFDLFSDEELKKYLNLLHSNARQEVIH